MPTAKLRQYRSVAALRHGDGGRSALSGPIAGAALSGDGATP